MRIPYKMAFLVSESSSSTCQFTTEMKNAVNRDSVNNVEWRSRVDQGAPGSRSLAQTPLRSEDSEFSSDRGAF